MIVPSSLSPFFRRTFPKHGVTEMEFSFITAKREREKKFRKKEEGETAAAFNFPPLCAREVVVFGEKVQLDPGKRKRSSCLQFIISSFPPPEAIAALRMARLGWLHTWAWGWGAGEGTAALSQGGGEKLLTRQGGGQKKIFRGDRGGNKNKIFLKFHKKAKFLSFTGKY